MVSGSPIWSYPEQSPYSSAGNVFQTRNGNLHSIVTLYANGITHLNADYQYRLEHGPQRRELEPAIWMESAVDETLTLVKLFIDKEFYDSTDYLIRHDLLTPWEVEIYNSLHERDEASEFGILPDFVKEQRRGGGSGQGLLIAADFILYASSVKRAEGRYSDYLQPRGYIAQYLAAMSGEPARRATKAALDSQRLIDITQGAANTEAIIKSASHPEVGVALRTILEIQSQE